MSGRKTLVLIAVLAVLCVGYWWVGVAAKSGREQAVAAKRLFSFKPDTIQTVIVSRREEPPVTAQAKNGAWQITSPFPMAANIDQWRKMAGAIANLTSEGVVAKGEGELAQYGLDKPTLQVHFTTESLALDDSPPPDAPGIPASRKLRALVFGSLTPTQDYRYARLDKGPVILVPEGIYKELNRPLLDLRDRSMIRTAQGGITRFEYVHVVPPSADAQYEPVKVVVERRENGRWHVTAPVQGAADQEVVGNLVATLEQMPGQNYVDQPESLTDYGLDPPRVQITAWTGKGSPAQTISFGGITDLEGEEKGVFVRRADSPAVFVVKAVILTFFPERPDSFRDRRLLTHAVTDIQRLRLRTEGSDVVLEKDDKTGWKMTQPVAEVDQEAVSTFLTRMKDLQGSEFVSEGTAMGLDTPRLQADITVRDGRQITLAVGQPTPDGTVTYARQDTGAPLLMETANLPLLAVTDFFFRSKDIYKFEEENCEQVVLNFEGTSYVFERDAAGQWLVREPAGKRWDLQSDMKALLKALNPVSATGIEPKERALAPSVTGLETPILTAEAVISSKTRGESDARVGPLKVGQPTAEDPHQRYATVAGRPELFRLSQALIDDVREALKGIRER